MSPLSQCYAPRVPFGSIDGILSAKENAAQSVIDRSPHVVEFHHG
jgi:hypothetical protein